MMRFDILVHVMQEGYRWWFKNEAGITGAHEGTSVWEILFVAIEEDARGWLSAVGDRDADD